MPKKVSSKDCYSILGATIRDLVSGRITPKQANIQIADVEKAGREVGRNLKELGHPIKGKAARERLLKYSET